MQFQSDDQNEFVRSSPQGFDMSGMLVKWGIATSRQQAEYVLIAIGIVCLLVAVYMLWCGSSAPRPPLPPNPYANGEAILPPAPTLP